MQKKQLSNFKARIKKANKGFGAMGSMMLSVEFQNMETVDLIELKLFLDNSKTPVKFDLLDKELERRVA